MCTCIMHVWKYVPRSVIRRLCWTMPCFTGSSRQLSWHKLCYFDVLSIKRTIIYFPVNDYYKLRLYRTICISTPRCVVNINYTQTISLCLSTRPVLINILFFYYCYYHLFFLFIFSDVFHSRIDFCDNY